MIVRMNSPCFIFQVLSISSLASLQGEAKSPNLIGWFRKRSKQASLVSFLHSLVRREHTFSSALPCHHQSYWVIAALCQESIRDTVDKSFWVWV